MKYAPHLKEHCKGVRPVIERHGRWWRVTCPQCGKRIAYLNTEFDAKQDWNTQMECAMWMRGEEDE